MPSACGARAHAQTRAQARPRGRRTCRRALARAQALGIGHTVAHGQGGFDRPRGVLVMRAVGKEREVPRACLIESCEFVI